MKAVFADTSGYFAALFAGDPRHAEARELFIRAEEAGWKVWTTSYVVIETSALVQARLGWDFVRELHAVYWPLSEVHYVNDSLHALASARHRQAARRALSLVDCTSFEFMEQKGLREAIAFDAHFQEAGFRLP